VGGGIRTVERAAELVSLGAKKVIVGSVASAKAREGRGKSGRGIRGSDAFLKSSPKIGRDRVIGP
jgi:phosphoribosyl-ATP pyrophosphohydrolase/phosphoribosyl-AMP cyclohydrolase